MTFLLYTILPLNVLLLYELWHIYNLYPLTHLHISRLDPGHQLEWDGFMCTGAGLGDDASDLESSRDA